MTQRLFAIPANQSRWDLADSLWPGGTERPHVFIQRFDLPAEPESLPELFRPLAGTRLYLFGNLFSVPDDPGCTRVHHSVLARRPDVPSPIRMDLHQSGDANGDDVFYSTDDEHKRYHGIDGNTLFGLTSDEYFSVDINDVAMKEIKVFNVSNIYIRRIFDAYNAAGRPKAKKKWQLEQIRNHFRHLGKLPRWTEAEGDWPFVDTDPMLFVGQILLSQNPTTKAHLTFDAMLYLFVGVRDGVPVCKVYRQSVGEQTAEAHYKLEELLALYTSKPNDADVLKKVVLEGDRFVHQFLLDQPELPAAALALLAKHGSNKELRASATKRLKPS